MTDFKLTASIHTIELRCKDINEDMPIEVKRCFNSISRNATGVRVIINPNKLNGDIFSFSEFHKQMDRICEAAGIEEAAIVRVDLRLDSYDAWHYEKYSKLYRYLISAMARAYTFPNEYRTLELFSQEQISVAIKNSYMEMEHYDREHKSHVTGNGSEQAKSRLELRSKRWKDEDNYNEIKKRFTEAWFQRLDNALQYLKDVHRAYNSELVKKYENDMLKVPRQFTHLKDLITRYQDCIYCKEQMIDLIRALPVQVNAERFARNYKQRYSIDYVGRKDLEKAVAEIKHAIAVYFDIQQ